VRCAIGLSTVVANCGARSVVTLQPLEILYNDRRTNVWSRKANRTREFFLRKSHSLHGPHEPNNSSTMLHPELGASTNAFICTARTWTVQVNVTAGTLTLTHRAAQRLRLESTGGHLLLKGRMATWARRRLSPQCVGHGRLLCARLWYRRNAHSTHNNYVLSAITRL